MGSCCVLAQVGHKVLKLFVGSEKHFQPNNSSSPFEIKEDDISPQPLFPVCVCAFQSSSLWWLGVTGLDLTGEPYFDLRETTNIGILGDL